MKYISLDLETTGLQSSMNQIIEIGAVIEDTLVSTPIEQLPHFHRYVTSQMMVWDKVALKMNWKLLQTILFEKDPNTTTIESHQLGHIAYNWLLANGLGQEKLVFAGKNFAGFDKLFLDHLLNWNTLIKMHHRALDPAPLYIDPKKDTEPPSLYECARRANIEIGKEHRAIDDAELVIKLLRYAYKYHETGEQSIKQGLGLSQSVNVEKS